MSNKLLDYSANRFCPAYGKTIGADLCYDSLMCLNHTFKISSTKELAQIEDIEAARKQCAACPYSNLE